jgi:hypothetical protein
MQLLRREDRHNTDRKLLAGQGNNHDDRGRCCSFHRWHHWVRCASPWECTREVRGFADHSSTSPASSHRTYTPLATTACVCAKPIFIAHSPPPASVPRSHALPTTTCFFFSLSFYIRYHERTPTGRKRKVSRESPGDQPAVRPPPPKASSGDDKWQKNTSDDASKPETTMTNTAF